MSSRRGLAARVWDLDRFGLTPRKLPARLRASGPKVLCLSLPKSGTHLIERALCLHPHIFRRLQRTIFDRLDPRDPDLDRALRRLRPAQLLVSHLVYSDDRRRAIERHKVKAIFMVRDPRDVAVSQAFYIARSREHHLHHEFAAEPSVHRRILMAIEGLPQRRWPSFATRLEAYAGWLSSDALVIRFEDLIGHQGGGSELEQNATLVRMFEFLELDVGPERLTAIRDKLFSSLSPTFRKGTVGQWRNYLDHIEVVEALESSVGPWLERYGYD